MPLNPSKTYQISAKCSDPYTISKPSAPTISD